MGMPPVRAARVIDVREEFDRRYVVAEADPAKAANAKRMAFKRALDRLLCRLDLENHLMRERKVDGRDRRPELERAHAQTQKSVGHHHHIGICTTRGMKKDVLCLEPCPDHVRFTQTTQTTTQLISCGEAQ